MLEKNSVENYEFKLEWELNDVVQYMTWSQKENPLSAEEQEKVENLLYLKIHGWRAKGVK